MDVFYNPPRLCLFAVKYGSHHRATEKYWFAVHSFTSFALLVVVGFESDGAFIHYPHCMVCI
jgi:hypothetical protein